MTNAIANAIANRASNERAKKTMTEKNIQKIDAFAKFCEQKAVADLLEKNKFDTNIATKDVYTVAIVSSVVQFALKAVSVDKLKMNASEILQTAMKLEAAKLDLMLEDCEIALSASRIKHSDKSREAHIVRMTDAHSQARNYSKRVINSLLALDILKAKSKNVYAINASNAVYKKCKERFANVNA